MSPKQRVAALRREMKQHGVAAYFVPSTDPHQSEYVPHAWRRREWMSGFTGSAGDLLVTKKEALLWTDSRYFLQAERELRGSGIKLMRIGEKGIPTIEEHLTRKLAKGDLLGVDPRVVSHDRAAKLEKALRKAGAGLSTIDENLVDRIWEERPALSDLPAEPLSSRVTGESAAAKLRRLRKEMKEQKADAHVLTGLDAVAWLYNVRGRDVEFNPLVVSYGLVTDREAFWFVDPVKVPSAAAKKLGRAVKVRPYEEIAAALRKLAEKKAHVWVDGAAASRWVVDLLDGAELLLERSPVAAMKAKKNDAEIEGMRAAHVRDGVAMVRFLRWLEETVETGEITEVSAAERLEGFRSEGERYRGLSFPTISSSQPHGAVIHYKATPETDLSIEPETAYLVDSGAQYLDGTTDITRTVFLGRRPPKEIRETFTLVLKGHIALATAKFPAGTRGNQIDAFARKPLWETGRNYKHGTGHGVGAYLCVHEGPQSISPHHPAPVPLEPGNILSNEPGFYVDGSYGLRIENLILVVEEPKLSKKEATFLAFETLTLCPIDTRLVEPKLLDPAETKWLNDYHKRVVRELGRKLGREDRAWLKQACAPI
ncbi:MAG: M24 family metallopeptidase [Candidatus Eisenbacteria bacterium]|nr:M24 family metallopeptidase [Candidatus Latescibacterota bacterium]MBD3302546.1 M24 family metallopeptidase [Candidatus Eisenbacteria bacterium]